ncbi:hypothetical protein SAMN05444156_0987 [Verrucomicrobium sp. GAS474]|uniref:hypothetical protein n=1 Tax=Verrucomicrobium sp. GAS474 TaxID=1882831 RepID=UPI00087C6E51|nr:hypothetical protein [Verrucomicrobium sp. GAS474]SDT94837.1 hypothetical protein SAMN05444156_0987 [Verrucomicrobium sp. GAS474]
MSPDLPGRRPARAAAATETGSALIITLAILVLITAILLAFFSQSALNRQISFSSAGQFRADLVARAALETIDGDLRTEIVSGSQSTAAGTATLYLPATPAAGLPCRVNDQGFANLVKQSTAGLPSWSGAAYTGSPAPVRAAANNSTRTAAAGGRFIGANRWNKAGLLGDPGTGTTPALPSGYTPPDWIVVTRGGTVTNAVTALPTLQALADAAPSNPQCAIGRFAYAIYDEGGLLDANVAGFPASLNNTDFATTRGLLPQVDLSTLPGVKNAGSFVTWRNPTTAATAAAYTNSVAAATTGFVKVASGDQALVGRQDLIDYVKANPGLIGTAALPYLGTASRDVDGPAFLPDPARPARNDITNPNVLKIRVTQAFRRSDNTDAVVGEPLLKHRFPLSRLALFADPAGNAALLQKYFSMQQRADGQWDYLDPDVPTPTPTTTLPTIKTLDQISGREPTFWEVLQAGIYAGSLGATNGNFNGLPTTQDGSATRQLLAIGLNLIDQYDSDDTPTVLRLGGTTPAQLTDLSITGVENLPYIAWFAQDHFRDQISVLAPNTNAYIDGYLFFTLWNPHRNAASALPGQFHIRFNGKTSITAYNTAIPLTLTSPTLTHLNTVLAFQTTTARTFKDIDALHTTDAVLASCSDMAKFPYPAVAGVVREVGLFIGQVTMPKLPEFPTSGNYIANTFPTPVTMVLEKQVGANWIPYQIIPNFNVTANNTGLNFASVSNQLNLANGFTNNGSAALISMTHPDPRSSRFGFFLGATFNMLSNSMNLVNSASGVPFNYNAIPTFNTTGATSIPLADYAYNVSSSLASSHYADPDAAIRKADANPATTASHTVYSPFGIPLAGATNDARPVVLNRPFRSVAEMGYAFRDTPWKSLNFSSQDSADGGLLDLFCVNENTEALRAGVVSLNSASQPVLATILTNAYRDPSVAGGTPLLASDATTLAQAIRTQLGPVTNPTLVVRGAADLPLLADKIAASLPDRFKFKREAFTRSFADIANGRTWNLLVDVIAQSGRYGSNAKTLNDFIVDGERRYWLHVAIDRYTGKVVSQFLEPVAN